MGLHNWATGEVVSETYMDEMARQGVIAASSFPGSPTLGMLIYRTDLNVNFWQWDGGAWKSLPQGIIDRSDLSGTGTSYGIGTSFVDVNGSSLTDTYISGERYYYDCGMSVSSNVDATVLRVEVQVDGTMVDYGEVDCHKYTSPVAHRLHMGTVLTGLSAGSHTVKCRIKVTDGFGNGAAWTTGAATLWHTS